ncbi:unnamed protein product [Arabidopsis lyrata]|uniref:Transmembrane protein n=1 Tax=Arabidopsis lyrata subsp. lyrata TaxID=81972 RepID=D7M205_ARALL|nr:uncharacterized protein LOC9307428 [Arabidopsis lyrata subsp. lyrata]EFH47617.1 hypothetical protein ARALYDRAFT_325471 [Arabidopsis lyrata subsp. lyrata]CAH8270539.1 unnamed protein product [Arabidopsis lyrata]|eukprot:XP_002871358.1 uncharacterized protein LOC9307428 [Arabidopsis lyrata subsp. lyrata]
MSKEKSYIIALLLSLLLCLSSQVGVSEANYNAVTTRYSDSRCANESSASPPPPRHYPRGRPRPVPVRSAVHSNSTKGKGP